jgi:hypothetical protein
VTRLYETAVVLMTGIVIGFFGLALAGSAVFFALRAYRKDRDRMSTDFCACCRYDDDSIDRELRDLFKGNL